MSKILDEEAIVIKDPINLEANIERIDVHLDEERINVPLKVRVGKILSKNPGYSFLLYLGLKKKSVRR